MRKTKCVRPAFWIAGLTLAGGTAHIAYTLTISSGDVTINGPATFMYSTESGSNSTDERESITITVVKQHGSSSQPTPAVKDH